MIIKKVFKGTTIQHFDTEEACVTNFFTKQNPKTRPQVIKQEFHQDSSPQFIYEDGTVASRDLVQRLSFPDVFTFMRTEEEIPKIAELFNVQDDLTCLISAISKESWAAIIAKLPNEYRRKRIVARYKEINGTDVGP